MNRVCDAETARLCEPGVCAGETIGETAAVWTGCASETSCETVTVGRVCRRDDGLRVGGACETVCGRLRTGAERETERAAQG